MNLIKLARCCALSALLGWGMAQAALADEAPAAPAALAGPVFALVNGKPISIQEFKARYNALVRQRFYHGEPPESQAVAVRREVANLLIERALLIEEAERRGIKPDAAKVERAVAAAETRYSADPEWQKQREELLPMMKEQATRQNLLEQIEKEARTVPPPAPAEVRAYYEQKSDLFTEPEKLRLSVILLAVDPGAPNEDWGKARERAQEIYLRIKAGADFAEQARQLSSHPSAGDGGDLGYLHGGMLPEKLQEKIDAFQVGEVSEPITTLEGIAVFRVEDRIVAKLREFSEVEPRARELLQRDQAEQAWKETNGRLRAAAKVEILVPLGDEAVAPEAVMPEAVAPEAAAPEAVEKKAAKKKATKKKTAQKKPL